VGTRFGLQPGSRIEFDYPPAAIGHDLMFSIQLRATASNGIILFASDERHSTYIALYMAEGRLAFSFGSGEHKAQKF
jgi:laminin alpha 3/5